MSHVSCLNSKMYIEVGCDHWQKVHNLLVDVCSLFESPKKTPNYSRNASKLFKRGYWHSKKGANHVTIMSNNRVLTNPTSVWSFR
jgi:hypothetical protein